MHRLHNHCTPPLCWTNLSGVPGCIPSRSDPRCVRTMLCKLTVYLQEIPPACHWRQEEERADLRFPNGSFPQEFTARTCSVHDSPAANSRYVFNTTLEDNLGVITNLVAGFNEFISERERAKQKSKDPRIILFDEIVLSKRNRGRSTFFSGRMTTDFLSDTSNHLWRSASASSFSPTTRKEIPTSLDWKSVVTRG